MFHTVHPTLVCMEPVLKEPLVLPVNVTTCIREHFATKVTFRSNYIDT